MLDLTTPEGLRAANEALAKLCRLVTKEGHQGPVFIDKDGRWASTNFLAGLRPDGTCDEAEVDGDLLWRVWCALSRSGFSVRFDDAEGYIDCEIVNADGELFYVEESEKTAHPVLALYLCAEAAGLLEGSKA